MKIDFLEFNDLPSVLQRRYISILIVDLFVFQKQKKLFVMTKEIA